jgi:DNA-binding transcriptional LysR family regulator
LQLLSIGLVYFLEVARTGSVSEAAVALTVAPSAISRQIAKLESGIGVPLFARHPRGMTLTDAGTRLLGYVRRNEAESNTLVDDLRAGRGLHSRIVTVACTEGFARGILPRAMASFRSDHADVVFHLEIVGPEEATRRVIDGVADIAITYSTRPQHGVRVEGSIVVPVYAIVPLAHELAQQEQVGLAELCEHPLALPMTGTLRELFDVGIEIEGTACNPVLVCDGLAPKYEFVRHGGGLALVGGVGDAYHDAADEGVAYVKVEHAVFRKREAQVQTMIGRLLPVPVLQFITALVPFIAPPEKRDDLDAVY